MDSINHPLPSYLICPAIRKNYLKSQCYKDIRGQYYLKLDNSYKFSNDKDESLHSHHLLPLIGCNNRETIANILFTRECCGACRNTTIGTTYYFCKECDKWYHKECVESPPILKSPYHLKHSLQLYICVDVPSCLRLDCLYCLSTPGCLIYHCSICSFNLDPICATKPPLINHPKMHKHTLYYFPRKCSLSCDVCGDNYDFFYFVCLHCDFVAHKMCIYVPRVIKISPHEHRLSFVSSLSSQKWSCGVCRQKIDKNCGAYSCMTKGCIFVVHSNCATKPIVWDGKELEGEPEEKVNESIKPPFEEINDGMILHFSHLEYPMRLNEDVQILYDEKKLCQACMLPIYIGKAYTCMRMGCDYVLHEACAYLPRVIQHALHRHSLTLEPSSTQTNRLCLLCYRDFFGFKYVCNNGCDQFSLDVRCASISDQYDHFLHRHPLFITAGIYKCLICNHQRLATLNCDECDFALCFRCATLPYKTKYKNDEHLVTFSYEKDANGSCWCDLCEETINLGTGFYRCNECEIALHINCVLGYVYMNPTSRIMLEGSEFRIIQNDASSTRPTCSGCQRRCQYKTMFVASSGDIYCSVHDIYIYYFKKHDGRICLLALENEHCVG